MKDKLKKNDFVGRSLFYYRRFGHLSDHFQYNKVFISNKTSINNKI
jgi:hypothetical protein